MQTACADVAAWMRKRWEEAPSIMYSIPQYAAARSLAECRLRGGPPTQDSEPARWARLESLEREGTIR